MCNGDDNSYLMMNSSMHSAWYIVRYLTNVSPLPFVGLLAGWNETTYVKCLAYIKEYYPSPPKFFPWVSNLETPNK